MSQTELQPEDVLDPVLTELENRYDRLKSELEQVTREIRAILTSSAVCPRCGGLGRRRIRGGLYGERQEVACLCRES